MTEAASDATVVDLMIPEKLMDILNAHLDGVYVFSARKNCDELVTALIRAYQARLKSSEPAASDRDAFQRFCALMKWDGNDTDNIVIQTHMKCFQAALAHRDAQLGSEEMVEAVTNAIDKAYFGHATKHSGKECATAAIEAIRKGLRG